MTTNHELIEGYKYCYPDLDGCYLHQNLVNCDRLFQFSNQIINDKAEVEYLQQLKDYYLNDTMGIVTQIEKRKKMIERAKNFDCSKIKENLPEVVIDEIKSYLEPELNYTRKFSILRHIDFGFSWWRDVDTYLFKVPKKLIIALKYSCKIYSSMSVETKDKKDKWCRMIIDETQSLFNKRKDMMRVDKLLANRDAEWGSDPNIKTIDKWFKFFLYIHTFKKYRAELETDIKTKTEKLSILKNKKIVVK